MKDIKDIILDNRNLIYSIIHKFKGRDYDDLYQVACIGIINAYKSFNSSYNVKFSTYAYNFIVGEIYKYLSSNRNIHISRDDFKLINAINKAFNYLTNTLGRSPTDVELSNFLEIDLYKLYEIRNIKNIDSLDYLYDNNNLYDFIGYNNNTDKLIDLKKALNYLTDEEKLLIKQRYFNNITQSELANIYNTNQVKISRCEKKILTKLKTRMS